MTGAWQRRNQRGSVMVELTLSITFLVPLFLGTLAFGYGFYQYTKLQEAVRDGARYASNRNYDSANATPSSAFLTAVQNMTAYGDPNGNTTTPLIAGLAPNDVNLTVTFTNGAPSAMTVAINGYRIPAFLSNITLNGKPYASFPYLAYWTPP